MVEDHTPANLLLELDRSARALRPQIEERLREAIRLGRLRVDTRLPPTRDLARSLGVSRGVVVAAYEQLVAEGFLVSRRRGGTFVAAGPFQAPPEGDEIPPDEPPRYDLRLGLPDLASFPRLAWQRSERNVMRWLPDRRLAALDARGAPELRRELAGYLGRVRGVVTSSQSMLVCGGFTQGLHLICRALSRRGARRIGFEEPCFSLHRLIAARAGLEPVPIDVDELGLRTEPLEESGVQAVVVTPAHQFPTGVVLGPGRRAALVEWAERCDAVIVEDDYDGEFRYDRAAIGSLQGLCPERVVYGGSASKALLPGLRLGWLAAPSWLIGELVGEKVFVDGAPPLLTDLTFADFLKRGEYDRHLRRMRRAYARRRAALVELLESGIPGARVSGVEAGLHAVVHLPAGLSCEAVVAAAAERGVGVERLRAYATDPGACEDALVIGYAGVSEPTLVAAMRELVRAVDEVPSSERARPVPSAAADGAPYVRSGSARKRPIASTSRSG